MEAHQAWKLSRDALAQRAGRPMEIAREPVVGQKVIVERSSWLPAMP